MFVGLTRAWREERRRQVTLDRLHGQRRQFASAVYPIATAVVIVAAIVYCSDKDAGDLRVTGNTCVRNWVLRLKLDG